MKKEQKEILILCDNCGYHNHDYNVKRYGTCTNCGTTLDKKAKFDYEMYCRLRLWRKQGRKL